MNKYKPYKDWAFWIVGKLEGGGIFGSGPLTVLGREEGMAWIHTKYKNRSKDWPGIEFHFVSGSLGSDGGRQV